MIFNFGWCTFIKMNGFLLLLELFSKNIYWYALLNIFWITWPDEGVERFYKVFTRISLVVQMLKHLPTMWETGSGRSPGEGNATHSSILAWKVPWMEEPGRLQSMGSRWVRHDWTTSLSFHTKVYSKENIFIKAFVCTLDTCKHLKIRLQILLEICTLL